MANYTIPIFLTLVLIFNYLLVYRKNRLVGNLLFIAMGISSLVAEYSYGGSNHEYAIYSMFFVVIGVISMLYDTFVKPEYSPLTR